MTEKAKTAVEAWKLADEAARQAERELKEAWAAYEAREGPAPGPELASKVTRLRAFANDRLSRALSAIKSQSGMLPR